MKTSIKFFGIIAIMMGFTMGAMAQGNQSANANIQGKAQVIAAIAVTAGVPLQFGAVTQNVTKTISNSGGILQGTQGTGTNGAEQVGTFTVNKGTNTLVTLAFGFPAGTTGYALKDGATIANELPITFGDFTGGVKLAKLTGATTDYPFTPTSDLPITNTGDLAQYFATGSFTVNIGGTVTPGASQVQGEYTGAITLTATYN